MRRREGGGEKKNKEEEKIRGETQTNKSPNPTSMETAPDLIKAPPPPQKKKKAALRVGAGGPWKTPKLMYEWRRRK